MALSTPSPPADLQRHPKWTLLRYAALLIAITVASLFMWPGLLRNLFSSNYVAHGYCLGWNTRLLALHVSSDLAIGLSYVAISLTLAWLVHRARHDIPFQWVFLAFGLFIIACGGTHFMEVVTLWQPVYWVSGDVKLITAIASVATAIVLPSLVPKALTMVQSAKISDERQRQLEQANQELEQVTYRLREMDELKTRFFANVSHELRTPLALTLGSTEKMLQGDLTSDQRRNLEVVHRSSRVLLKQVNDLLDLSKLEAGAMSLRYAEVDLGRMVRQTAAQFESVATDRGIAYEYTGPESLPAQVDAERVERILLNLLSNAFKFTPAGGKIRCELRSSGSHCTIAVSDSGPGVSPGLRGAVFDRFRQGDGGDARRFGGTGLGLAIVREFAELHGGHVAVGDAAEGGAVFSVELPLRAPQQTEVSAAAGDATAGEFTEAALDELRAPSAPAVSGEVDEALSSAPMVLVVEDNPEMNRFIVESLAGEYRVASAFDGKEGLDKALVLKPDLVLSDIMMPHMNGEELVREMRARPEFESTPIILLTAKADQHMRVQVLRQGAQDYIMKPFSVEELRVRVRNLTSISRARRVLQAELATQTEDVQELAHEVSHRKRQLDAALDALRQSESRFRRLVESNLIGVITVAFDGRIIDANEAFLRLIGYSREDLISGRLNWLDMTSGQHHEADRKHLEQLRRTGSAGLWERDFLARDGVAVPVLVGVALLEGAPEAGIGFVLDLTERKRAEARVAAQYDVAKLLSGAAGLEDCAQPLLECIGTRFGCDHGELWLVEREGEALSSLQTWTAAGCSFPEFTKFCNEERINDAATLPGRVALAGTPLWVPDLQTERQFRRASIALREGLHGAFGFPIKVGDSVLGVFAFFSRRMLHADPETMHTLSGVASQVGQFVERKRGEAALRESERRFRTMTEAIPQIVWTATSGGALDYANQRWEEYTGVPRREIRGRGWAPLIHPDDLTATLGTWEKAVNTGGTYELECRIRRRDGQYRWFLARAVPFHDAENRITKWFGSSTDIDDQKRAEQATRELAAIVESSDDAILSNTLDGVITTWNKAAERVYGYKADEVLGRPMWLLSPPDRMHEVPNLLERIRHGEPVDHFHTVRMTKDGRSIDVALSVSPIRDAAGRIMGAATIARDITEQKKTEQVLRNSEKLASVGRLAATIAHEINNPLEAVSNLLYLLEAHRDLDATAREYVTMTQQELDRITHIVKQTLGFYREARVPLAINVAEMIDDILDLYSRKLTAKRIQIERRYEGASTISAFPGEMRQVLSNLIVNALEANSEGGSLKVHVYPGRDWSEHGREGIRVVVADTGSGISRENLRRLFEPFFTTKGEKGTGLGLWVSHGIVAKHGGIIRVHSSTATEHSGTVFSVFLPKQSDAEKREDTAA